MKINIFAQEFSSEPYLIACLLLFSISNYGGFVCGYTCETPEEWLKTAAAGIARDHTKDAHAENSTQMISENGTTARINIRIGQKWPGAVVPYKLHSSLSMEDIVEVRKAFDEFHRKTCIRFRPWVKGDSAYTSIELDNKVCGLGHVCMQGGYQFAKFGQTCREMKTMIHELGHNLCLDHEQSRPDRDEWITYDRCSEPELIQNHNAIQKHSNPISGMYDYSSQMHYFCGTCGGGGWPKIKNVGKCGSQITYGLSLLDADHLNELYNCHGCFRHRWKSLQTLTATDRKYMYSFGYTDSNGYPMYPCRAFLDGEIVIGKYIHQFRKCFVSFSGKEHELTRNVQVLTFPGGLEEASEGGNVIHRYELANVRTISMEQVLKVGVPSGRTPNSSGGPDGEGVGYIAFGTLILGGSEIRVSDSIGKVWKSKSDEYPVGYFSEAGQEHILKDNFKVLVCKRL